MTLKEEQVLDLQEQERDKEYPVYTWNNTSLPGIYSINDIQRELVEGGFTTDRLITITARKYNATRNNDGTVTLVSLYTSLPRPQQIISVGGVQFRIQSVKPKTPDSYFRLIGYGITRGV